MESTTSSHHGYISGKDDYLRRLRRIEGQARGLQKMVEDEKYCIDILTQVSAMTSALQSVALGLLDDHLSHCVLRPPPRAGRRPTRRSKKRPARSPAWSAPSPSPDTGESRMSVTAEYVVTGMTCQHCVSSVSEEVERRKRRHRVRVDLESGQLVVISDDEIPFEAIEAAVDEAGYSVAAA